MRKAEELSTTTAPAVTASGANSREVAPPTATTGLLISMRISPSVEPGRRAPDNKKAPSVAGGASRVAMSPKSHDDRPGSPTDGLLGRGLALLHRDRHGGRIRSAAGGG